jgi:hypothetical protein
MRRVRRAILSIVFAIAAAGAAWASSGVVIDPSGEPLEEVKVCYHAGNVEQLCVYTDKAGAWELPPSSVDRVRLSHRDCLPREIGGGDQPEPVILYPGATLIVRLVDPAGEPLADGEVDVLLPSGKRFGPFPVRSAAGTRVNSLDPGPVVILGRSEGFAETRAKESDLAAGEETVVVLRLDRAAP